VYELSPRFVGMVGYYASLQSTLSGLSLCKDISVTCFMKGGNLVDFVCAVLRLQKDRLVQDFGRGGRGIEGQLTDVADVLKGAKIRTLHLNQNKKFREFGTRSVLFIRGCLLAFILIVTTIHRPRGEQPRERVHGRPRWAGDGGAVLPGHDLQGAGALPGPAVSLPAHRQRRHQEARRAGAHGAGGDHPRPDAHPQCDGRHLRADHQVRGDAAQRPLQEHRREEQPLRGSR
jgi:hypothetical protein